MISEQNTWLGRIGGIVFADMWDVVRRPAYFFSLLFFGSALYFSKDLVFFAFEQKWRLLQEIGLTIILMASLWFSYLASLITVNQELERKTIYTLLSKPLTRADFVMSKYFSIFGLVLVGNLFLIGLLFFALFLENLTPSLTLIQAVLLVLGESLIFPALALWGAIYLSPLLNCLFLFVMLALGHLHPFLTSYLSHQKGLFSSFLEKLFLFIIPNLDLFYIATEVGGKKNYSFFYVLVAFLYGIVYTLIILWFTFIRFDTKEF